MSAGLRESVRELTFGNHAGSCSGSTSTANWTSENSQHSFVTEPTAAAQVVPETRPTYLSQPFWKRSSSSRTGALMTLSTMVRM